MYGRIVKHDALIVVRSAFGNVSRPRQGNAHEAMPDNKWDGCPLLLRERQELRRKLTDNLAVERDVVCDPRAPKDREQQQRVFRRLSERFRLVRIEGGP